MGASVRLAGTVLFAALASVALVPVLGGGPAEVVFGTFMLTGLLVVLQLAVDGWRSSRREASRVLRLAGTRPETLARAAVAEERRRLTADLDATVREALAGIAELARTANGPEALRGIQRDARAAASELRRQLGLLRAGHPDVPAAREPDAPAHLGRVPGTPAHPTPSEALLATVVAVLAGLEVAAVAPRELYPTSSVPLTAALSAAAAGTLAWRRCAPVTAALACAGIFAAGSLAGTPVSEGLWFLVVGALLWTLAARLRLLGVGGLAVLVLVSVTLVTRWLHAPENLGVCVLVEAVALLGGLSVRLLARRRSRAEASATVREAELQSAVDLAVAAERGAIAREVHDVVSHAVGLVAVQAAAAEVTWHTDPTAARRALGLVRATAEDTLGEIDRLLPGEPTATKTVADLEALTGRIRAAGTSVTLEVRGDPGPEDLRVAYRVVQEALTNVIRHAPGAVAWVRVVSTTDGAEIEVRDDGPGIAGTVSRGYGLVGLAERVELAGGSLITRSGPDGRGFVVAATLPSVRSAMAAP